MKVSHRSTPGLPEGENKYFSKDKPSQIGKFKYSFEIEGSAEISNTIERSPREIFVTECVAKIPVRTECTAKTLLFPILELLVDVSVSIQLNRSTPI